MKNKLLLLSLIVLLNIGLVNVFAGGDKETASVGAKKKIIVGTEGTYKPYSYHDESGKLTGYDVEIVEALAKQLGYDVEFVESRWDGLLAGLKSNRWDIVANQVWWNESRAEEYLLSKKYLVAGASVLLKADNPAKKSDDLKGKKAAVSLTSSFRPFVESLTDKTEFQDDFVLAADLLRSGRVDFVVNDTQTIGIYIKDNPQAGLKVIPLDGAKTTDVVFALNKENAELLAEINAAIDVLSENGTINALNEKYFAGVK